MIIESIINEIDQSNWQPEFILINSIEEVSDLINLPHEDYPLNVNSTQTIIEVLIKENKRNFTFNDACLIQNELFYEKKQKIKQILEGDDILLKKFVNNLPALHIDLGLRNLDVKVGNYIPPKPIELYNLIQYIFDVQLCDKIINDTILVQSGIFESTNFKYTSINYWYKMFQTIHPFNDLNGRVGGIILAVLSFHSVGKFLTVKR